MKKFIFGILLNVLVKMVNIYVVFLTNQLTVMKLQKRQKVFSQKLLKQKVFQEVLMKER